MSESAPAAEARFTLNTTVRNQGSGSSSSTTLLYYRSTDSTISTGDTEVGTDSVRGLNSSGISTESVSLTAPSTSGTYYYGACVDSVSGESNTENNCSPAVTVTVGVASAMLTPDLVVDTPTVKDNSAIAGVTFTISATVSNQGNGASASTWLRYYRSTDATITSSDTLLRNFYVDGLNPSGSSTDWAERTAPSTAGTYYYGACVDSVTGESDTANNCSSAVTVLVGVPDLAVESPTVTDSTPYAGASFTLSVTVRNQGSISSGSTVLRYYRSADTNITTDDTRVGSYVTHTSASNNPINLTAPSTPGTYYYGACVDAVTGESDTANNCSEAVTVAVVGTPDLVVDTPTVSNSSPTAGTSFILSATVRNQGSGSSPATTLRYYRSTDLTISSSDDRQVDYDQMSGLSVSDTSTESTSLTALSRPGTYYYGACVGLVEGESSRTNNCSAAVTVTVIAALAPDLVVDTPTASDIHPGVGTVFRLYATVRNQGDDASGPATLLFYRSTDSTITTSDERVGSGSTIRGLSPSETDFLYDNTRAPSTPGTYYYGACVVSSRDESNTANNCSPALTIVLSPPDLVVDTPFIVSHFSVDAGSDFYLHPVVRNQGTGSSAPIILRYYLSTDSTITSEDTSVRTNSAGSLGSSGSYHFWADWLQAPSTAGTYYYGACVDAVPGESSTTNNCSAAVTVTVSPADLAILSPTVFTLSGSAPAAGAEFVLRASVINRGNVPSVSTTLRYYRSTDATITSADTPVGTDSVGSLSPHRYSLEGIDLTAPSAAGTYYYGACVDTIGDEWITTNNCSEAVQVTVGAVQPPALTLRLTTCFLFQNQHFVTFRVTAHVPLSSLVVKTYQVEGRNNTKHIMETIEVGNLAAGNSYTKLTSRYFPAHLRRHLTTYTADVAWDNGALTPGSLSTTTAVPDPPPHLPPPIPTDTPTPPAWRPTQGQVWNLYVALHGTQYAQYANCGISGRPPCPTQDDDAWWSSLPSYVQQCAFEGCSFVQYD